MHETEAEPLRPAPLAWANLRWSGGRALLAGGLLAFAAAIGAGVLAPGEAAWLRTLFVLAGLGLAVLVALAPEHFVHEHLVRHVLREHALRVFLWTFGALAVAEWATQSGLGIEAFIREHTALALLVAAAVGVIPESGPHLVFATLYATGALPFSVLLTSSAVQDGHGMLPLLAESPADFLRVKAINLVAGLALGFTAMLLGF